MPYTYVKVQYTHDDTPGQQDAAKHAEAAAFQAPVDRDNVPIVPGDTVWYREKYAAGGICRDYNVVQVAFDGQVVYVYVVGHYANADRLCLRYPYGETFAELTHYDPDSFDRLADELEHANPADVTREMLRGWSVRLRRSGKKLTEKEL